MQIQMVGQRSEIHIMFVRVQKNLVRVWAEMQINSVRQRSLIQIQMVMVVP